MRFHTAIPIGEGGVGRVLRAFDPDRGHDVAIKLLEKGGATRLKREADAQRRLDQPHICPIFDVGTYNETPCITMRFIDGAPITDAVAGLSLADRISVFLQAVDAVAYAHEHGVLHRDLKPGNILVEQTPGGPHAWLVDFGLARSVDDETLTIQGEAFGTPGYMAPEQATGEPDVDERADVFGLGAILFELVAGRRPFQADSAAQVLIKTVNTDAPSLSSVAPSVPQRLARIVSQCLERQRALRYQSAGDLAADLRAFLAGEKVRARHTGLWYRARRLAAANPGPTLAVGTMAVAVLLFAVAALWTRMEGQRFAADQSAVASRYSDFARRLESQAALIQARPLHDATRSRQALASDLRTYARDMPEQGPARVPAHTAVGRAAGALGDYWMARGHLLAALALDPANVSLSGMLGRSEAELYFQAEEEALALTDPALREEALTVARDRHMKPAMAYLRAARDEAGITGLINRGLVAWFEKRYEESIELLERAARQSNWPVRPLMLAGRVQLHAGNSAEVEGALPRAAQYYDQAHATFSRVTGLARSYAEAYRADCLTAGLMARLRIQGVSHGGGDVFATALEACDRAVTANPSDVETLLTAADTYERTAVARNARRDDPGQLLSKARQIAERAVDLAPEHPGSYRVLAGLDVTAVRWRLADDGDSASILERAVERAKRAVELDGGRAESLTLLAQARQFLARTLYLGGEDGDEQYAAAAEALERAIEVSPTPVRERARLAEILAWQGYYRYLHGREADAVLTRSVEVARKAVARGPKHLEALQALGYTAWTLADYRYRLAEADGTVAREAFDAYREALAIDPTPFATRFNIQGPMAILARIRLERVESAAELVERMREIGESLRAESGEDASLEAHFAEILMLEARQQHFEGRVKGALAGLDSAQEEAIAALETVDELEAAALLAEIVLLRHEWRQDAGLGPGPIASDLRRLDGLVQSHPDLPRLKARLGQLHLMAAGIQPKDRERHLAQAESMLDTALDVNPLLRFRYGSSLERTIALHE